MLKTSRHNYWQKTQVLVLHKTQGGAAAAARLVKSSSSFVNPAVLIGPMSAEVPARISPAPGVAWSFSRFLEGSLPG